MAVKEIFKLRNNKYIDRANKLHGNKYNYSKFIYKGMYKKVIVNCSVHGDFEVTPDSHFRGYGCRPCKKLTSVNKNKKTLEQFIEEARKVHGDKYGYNNFTYTLTENKGTIDCYTHGPFEQSPAYHLAGNGCKECTSLTKEEVVEKNSKDFFFKCEKIHGDRYDYSKFVYKGNDVKGVVVCRIHGDFKQKPVLHLRNGGCRKCSMIEMGLNKRLKNEDFIKKALEVHDGLYDYSKVKYTRSDRKVVIICKEHGEFEQVPSSHLTGAGCGVCGVISSSERKRLTLEDFIEKAISMHGKVFRYDKVTYLNALTDVSIGCTKHGYFKQTPGNHLSGNGCPRCKRSRGEEYISKVLDKLKIAYVEQFKIPEIDNLLRYDFFLPSYNLLIEFQGEQHYRSVDFFGGEKGFTDLKRRDSLKKTMSKETGRKLIYFNFSQLKRGRKGKLSFKKLVTEKIKLLTDLK